MSDNKPLLPTTDDGKNNFYITIVPYINLPANQLRFNTPTGILSSLNSHFGQWGPNWTKIKDDTQRTTTVVTLKDTLEVALDDDFDDVYEDIPNSALTANDKAIFQIFPRKVPSPAIVSKIAPDLTMDTIGHLWAKVHFTNTATPDSKEAPEGNIVFFQTYVGAAGIPDADIVFVDGNTTSSSTHIFHFTKAQVGQTCYIECFYQIRKGQRSPASITISFVIM